ncbi:MAG: protein kinase [Deltaproteobacteria bacterium]|nr:protein kinase [Deltaproteobacteria bacterium]
MDQKRVVWVAEVVDRATLTRLLRAAIVHGLAHVKLTRPPSEKGTHTLQLRLDGEPVVVLSAESRGRQTKAGFPLQLAPLDPSHVAELEALARANETASPASVGIVSSRASAYERPSPGTPMRAHAKTIPDPEPWEFEDRTHPLSESPLASSRPARTPRNAVDADALATIRSAASPLVAGMSDPRTTSRQIPVYSGASSAAPITPDPAEGTLIPVEHAEPVTSQSSVHTLRTKGGDGRDDEITDWGTDGPDADDLSLGESVIFDPDVFAREAHVSAPSRGSPLTVDDPSLGADGESVSVIFGNEETLHGAGASGDTSLGVVVGRRADEDLSLTPTLPFELPMDMRKTSRDLSHEEGASYEDPTHALPPRAEPATPARIPSHMPKGGQSSARMKAAQKAPSPRRPQAPVSLGAASSPRTQKRSTAQMVTGGRIIANRYRIETLVGAGAVGAVFKAAHVDLPRTFAIKLLHPHYRADPHLMASFRAEARAASLLDHPNVTVVHDFGEEPDGLVYIVMEYLQGMNLQALLDEERRLSPRRAIEIMLQVCGALMAAHDRGIVHRDVKPDNIMLVPTRDDEGDTFDLVKVCDFGIAALETAPGAEGGEITAGTPEYMAPEQAAGRADARTDVYACGIVLYEMLVGKPPFVADSPIATLAKHAKERAKRPSEIVPNFPAALEAIIMRAIEKEPERRFQTMRDLRAELKRLL